MPPHLHPRSSATTTLFASTLAASFIIVGIPHIFPCPAPRKGYLDEDGTLIRKRRRRERSDGAEETERPVAKSPSGAAQLAPGVKLVSLLENATSDSSPGSGSDFMGRSIEKGIAREREDEDMGVLFRQMKAEADELERERRECPVPKPRGKIGELLGFGRDGRGGKAEDER